MQTPLAASAAALTLIALPGQQPPKPKPEPQPEHLLRYAFRAGDTGSFQMLHSLTQTSGDNPMIPSKTQVADCSWRVIAVQAKTATVELRFDRVRERKVTGKPGTYDTDSAKGDAVRFGSQLAGAVIRLRVDPRGRLEIRDDGTEMQKRAQREALQLIVRELPQLPVAVGAKWIVPGPDAVGSAIRINASNELRSVEKKKVTIDFVMTTDPSPNGMKVEFENSKGRMVFDLGRFVPDRVEQSLTMSLAAGGVPKMKLRMLFRLGAVGTVDRPRTQPKPKARPAPKGRPASRPHEQKR